MSQEGKGEDKDRKLQKDVRSQEFVGSVWEANVQVTAVFDETLHGEGGAGDVVLYELAQH